VTKNLLQNLWVNQPVDTKGFRRVVYTLIDSLSQDEFGLTSLTVIKNFDEYTYNHSLNVGVLSLALGQRLNLEKKSLVKLGTAGLLHDIGKVAIEKDVIYKPTSLSEREWDLLKLHCHFGVGQIIKTRGLDDIALSAIISAYQHHWNYDGSGYPAVDRKEQQPVLFARIIRICDAYDAMTTSRPYQIIPYLPSVAVRVLWNRRGTYFDPLLTKIFVQLTGLYPVGSCLELSSGEICLVIRQNPGSLDLPIVKTIIDRDSNKIDGALVDLLIEMDLKIARPVYPEKYGINPAAYFVS
jgi:HD-GYP domain-containing protein (c-di-GMP phosphodiesterase class II)